MKSIVFLFAVASLVACGDDTSPVGGGAQGGAAAGGAAQGGAGGAAITPQCTDPVAVPCEDQVVLQMNLKTTPTSTGITNTPDGEGFISVVDATAGGAFNANPPSYTYGRFTETGIEAVAISDEDALASMDWDIAFRRYVGRINSGNSGPSCVSAARLPGTPDFDSVTSVDDNLTFRTDNYFTDSCDLIADGTGLEGSPATALSSYWTYPGCVSMSHNVFIVKLADGRNLKLTVLGFYNDAAQEQCDMTGSAPMSANGSGNIKIRWAFLP